MVTEDKLKGIIPTGHAAIIWTSSTVVEALSKGVTTGPNDWNTTRNSCYGVTVIGTTAAQDTAAANWSYKQIGKPYNFNYLDKNTRSKFYCSQLVYAAYLDNYGINLDTSSFLTAIHPIELVQSASTRTIYKK
nr:YiiX/YebB-like N1pC/P60 family cysteine hydrolase [Anaerocolumna cellulosilytica]